MSTTRGFGNNSLKFIQFFKFSLVVFLGALLWVLPQRSWAPGMQIVHILQPGDYISVVYNGADSSLDSLDGDGLQFNRVAPYDFTSFVVTKIGMGEPDPNSLNFSIEKVNDEYFGINFGSFDPNDYGMKVEFSGGAQAYDTTLFPDGASLAIKANSIEIVKAGGQGNIPLNSESLNFNIQGNSVTVKMFLQADFQPQVHQADFDQGDKTMGDVKSEDVGAGSEGEGGFGGAASCNLKRR